MPSLSILISWCTWLGVGLGLGLGLDRVRLGGGGGVRVRVGMVLGLDLMAHLRAHAARDGAGEAVREAADKLGQVTNLSGLGLG